VLSRDLDFLAQCRSHKFPAWHFPPAYVCLTLVLSCKAAIQGVLLVGRAANRRHDRRRSVCQALHLCVLAPALVSQQRTSRAESNDASRKRAFSIVWLRIPLLFRFDETADRNDVTNGEQSSLMYDKQLVASTYTLGIVLWREAQYPLSDCVWMSVVRA
jgi:hypothetical protein